MDQPSHPLRRFLRLRAAERDTNVEQAADAFAREVSAEGTPVTGRALIAIAQGVRRPRPPLSEKISKLSGIDELTLLKWGRESVSEPDTAPTPSTPEAA